MTPEEIAELENFNSLPHTEVDFVDLWGETEGGFQLTTSHRGRHRLVIHSILFSIFQLTTSHRGRLF